MNRYAAEKLFEKRTGLKTPAIPRLTEEQIVNLWRSDYGRLIPRDVAVQRTLKPYVSAAIVEPERFRSILENGPARLQSLILKSLEYSKDVQAELAASGSTRIANSIWQLSQQMIPVFRELSAIQQYGAFLDRAEKVGLANAAREYVGEAWRSVSFWDSNLTASERFSRGLNFALAIKGAQGKGLGLAKAAGVSKLPSVRKFGRVLGVAEGDISPLANQVGANAARRPSQKLEKRLEDGPSLSEEVLLQAGAKAYKRETQTKSTNFKMPVEAIEHLVPQGHPPGLRTILDNPDLLAKTIVTDAELEAMGFTRGQVLDMASKKTVPTASIDLSGVIRRIKDKKDPRGPEKLLRGLLVAVGAIEKHHMIPRAVAKRLKREFGLDLSEYNWTLELEYKVHRAYHAGSGYRYRGGAYNNAFMERVDLLVSDRKEITRSEILSILDEVQAQFPKSSK